MVVSAAVGEGEAWTAEVSGSAAIEDEDEEEEAETTTLLAMGSATELLSVMDSQLTPAENW